MSISFSIQKVLQKALEPQRITTITTSSSSSSSSSSSNINNNNNNNNNTHIFQFPVM